jgi:hypothetical protein
VDSVVLDWGVDLLLRVGYLLLLLLWRDCLLLLLLRWDCLLLCLLWVVLLFLLLGVACCLVLLSLIGLWLWLLSVVVLSVGQGVHYLQLCGFRWMWWPLLWQWTGMGLAVWVGLL